MAIDQFGDIINEQGRRIKEGLGLIPPGGYYGPSGISGVTPSTTGRDTVRTAPETISERVSQVLPANPYVSPRVRPNPMGPDTVGGGSIVPTPTPNIASVPSTGYQTGSYAEGPVPVRTASPTTSMQPSGYEGISYSLGPANPTGDETARRNVLSGAGVTGTGAFGGVIPDRNMTQFGGQRIDTGYYAAHPEEAGGTGVVPANNEGIEALRESRKILSDQAQGFRLPVGQGGMGSKARTEAAQRLVQVDTALANAIGNQTGLQTGVIQKRGELGLKREQAGAERAYKQSQLELDMGKFNVELQRLGLDTRKMFSEERYKTAQTELAKTKNESERLSGMRNLSSGALTDAFKAGVQVLKDTTLPGQDNTAQLSKLIEGYLSQTRDISLKYAPDGTKDVDDQGRPIVKQGGRWYLEQPENNKK